MAIRKEFWRLAWPAAAEGLLLMLLTAADLRSRERYLNVMNCINALWEKDVLPIVNENDSVSVDELKFGDNDTLAGMLASITDSQLTIILTTEQGLRERVDGVLGERISVVEKLDDAIRGMAGDTDNSEFSIGGMSSKLRAADIVTAAGATLVGIGCAVEKGFQGGGDRLRAAGVNLKSLAIIESAEPGNIVFRDDD